jgi:hypothetical protein
VEKRIFLSGTKKISSFPNLRADVAVFLISAKGGSRGGSK